MKKALSPPKPPNSPPPPMPHLTPPARRYGLQSVSLISMSFVDVFVGAFDLGPWVSFVWVTCVSWFGQPECPLFWCLGCLLFGYFGCFLFG